MRRHAIACTLALCALLFGGAMKGDAARERSIIRETEDSLDEAGRYVDMSVSLHVVRKATPGEPGAFELLKDAPIVVVRTHDLGGLVDTQAEGGPMRVGPGRAPVDWYCSEAMEAVILHGDDLPDWVLLTGGEGVGKTSALAQWTYCRAVEHIGYRREIGITAPTNERMAHVLEAIDAHWRPEWMASGTLVPTERSKSLTFRAGPRVRFVSAHQASKKEGSRIQGYNWVAHGGDELQDHHDKEADIVARGRSAPGGKYKRFNTCTAKDATDWRTFKDGCVQSPDWHVLSVAGIDSPFVPQKHWDRMRNGAVTLREWQRRALAIDVGPEAAVYHCFECKLADGSPGNVRPLPLGAVDVTASELAAYGRNIGVLIGHDPGKRQHVSMFLRAYRVPGRDARPRWYVVDEVTSAGTTVNSHAQEVLKLAREKYGCNTLDWKGRPSESAPQVLVRIDPHTRTGDEHPGRDVYAIWKSLGMLARAAAYNPSAATPTPAVIKRESRIDLVNTLLCATTADGEVRRLFILCDDKGKVAAPKLLTAFESMERNAASDAEHEKKDANDLSHWPCAVGYALWQVEHPRMMAVAS